MPETVYKAVLVSKTHKRYLASGALGRIRDENIMPASS